MKRFFALIVAVVMAFAILPAIQLNFALAATPEEVATWVVAPGATAGATPVPINTSGTAQSTITGTANITGGVGTGTGTNPYAITARDWGVDLYWQFSFNGKGYENFSIDYTTQSSASGPRDFVMKTSNDGGTTWVSALDSIPALGNAAKMDFAGIRLAAGMDDCDNDIIVRIIVSSTMGTNGSAFAAAGTNRISSITVWGEEKETTTQPPAGPHFKIVAPELCSDNIIDEYWGIPLIKYPIELQGLYNESSAYQFGAQNELGQFFFGFTGFYFDYDTTYLSFDDINAARGYHTLHGQTGSTQALRRWSNGLGDLVTINLDVPGEGAFTAATGRVCRLLEQLDPFDPVNLAFLSTANTSAIMYMYFVLDPAAPEGAVIPFEFVPRGEKTATLGILTDDGSRDTTANYISGAYIHLNNNNGLPPLDWGTVDGAIYVGHKGWTTWAPVSGDPTTEERFCTNCGERETRPVTTCLHPNPETVGEDPGDCLNFGHDAGVWCDDCETWLSGGDAKTVKGPHIDEDGETSLAAQAPNCIDAGWSAELSCSACHAVTTPSGSIGALGANGAGSDSAKHKNWATASEITADCVTVGVSAGNHCSSCGYDTRVTGSLAPSDHEDTVGVLINDSAATCTVDGYTGDMKCTACNSTTNFISTGTTIPKLGHDMSITGVESIRHMLLLCDCSRGDLLGDPVTAIRSLGV
ncbi:MAG: hypothetical protein FWF10_09495, partial [Clostridiales bacterium]|nr:hypothetical protein [Clostridiales bacterium]